MSKEFAEKDLTIKACREFLEARFSDGVVLSDWEKSVLALSLHQLLVYACGRFGSISRDHVTLVVDQFVSGVFAINNAAKIESRSNV